MTPEVEIPQADGSVAVSRVVYPLADRPLCEICGGAEALARCDGCGEPAHCGCLAECPMCSRRLCPGCFPTRATDCGECLAERTAPGVRL